MCTSSLVIVHHRSLSHAKHSTNELLLKSMGDDDSATCVDKRHDSDLCDGILPGSNTYVCICTDVSQICVYIPIICIHIVLDSDFRHTYAYPQEKRTRGWSEETIDCK